MVNQLWKNYLQKYLPVLIFIYNYLPMFIFIYNLSLLKFKRFFNCQYVVQISEQVKFFQVSCNNEFLSSAIEKTWCTSNFFRSLQGSKWAITIRLVSIDQLCYSLLYKISLRWVISYFFVFFVWNILIIYFTYLSYNLWDLIMHMLWNDNFDHESKNLNRNVHNALKRSLL